jgi:hypothetical protein
MRVVFIGTPSGREQQEAIMGLAIIGFNNPQQTEMEMNRCSVCGGKFGLVRYYTWRGPGFCSQGCLSRFRTREVNGLKWLFGMRSA